MLTHSFHGTKLEHLWHKQTFLTGKFLATFGRMRELENGFESTLEWNGYAKEATIFHDRHSRDFHRGYTKVLVSSERSMDSVIHYLFKKPF
jgi:hypothetical protein